jgi:hypothetical protein
LQQRQKADVNTNTAHQQRRARDRQVQNLWRWEATEKEWRRWKEEEE